MNNPKSANRPPAGEDDAATRREPAKKRKASRAFAHEQAAQTSNLNLWFGCFAAQTAKVVGRPYIFLLAVASLVVWGASGPAFHFSDTWQLVINTGTTIVTFLMVFLIQNTQNRDARAIHLKLDELIRSHIPARNDLIDIELLSDEELDHLEERYAAIVEQKRARKQRTKRGDEALRSKD